MAIERNVIFLFPLAPVVTELKKQLEADNSNIEASGIFWRK
jgi:hypothetical protein